jgi:cytochrome P450
MLLSQHPHVRAKLEAELDAVLGDRAPTYADVPKLVYTDRVIRESMRLYPPAWSTGREAIEDVTIGGQRFAKGANFWFVQWTMHRDARFFPRPRTFDPDRWEGDLQKRIPKYAYFPFGGGPRLCIGHAFATMEAVLALATIARKWRFDVVPGHEVELHPVITLRPKNGLPVRVSRR